MPLITLGDDTKLKLKIPSKGDTNWSEDFKSEFAQKIVDHDHTGVNGKGSKITTAAIEDGAVTTAKITDSNVTTAKIADANITTPKIADANVTTAKIADANVTAAKIGSDVVLSTLNNVSNTSPTAGQGLTWSGTEWAPETFTATVTDVITNASEASSYNGSAKFINITSTVDVTFTTDLADRIIYIQNGITVNFTVDSLTNCTILGKDAEIIVESPYQPDVDTSGNYTLVENCDIRGNSVRFLTGAYAINPAGDPDSHTGLVMYVYNSTIISENPSANDPTFGLNFSTITNFTDWESNPLIWFRSSLFLNHSGVVLSTVPITLSESRIYKAKTASSGISGVVANFYATIALVVIRYTDASFNNSLGMSAGSSTIQHVFM